MLELAEKSTRVSLNVNIKAPVVFLPQSSVSTNVIVADLGLVTVKNYFEIVPSRTHTKIPPILDIMSVALSELKMYRCAAGSCVQLTFSIRVEQICTFKYESCDFRMCA